VPGHGQATLSGVEAVEEGLERAVELACLGHRAGRADVLEDRRVVRPENWRSSPSKRWNAGTGPCRSSPWCLVDER